MCKTCDIERGNLLLQAKVNVPPELSSLNALSTCASYWRTGASQPSGPTGTIFLYIYTGIYDIYLELMHTVMFYVTLNKHKRLGETA